MKLKYKDNKQEQALKTMQLYKERGINPFAGIFLALIQLPILIALYMVFYRGGLDVIHTETLYSFIPSPETINKVFIGLLDITQKSTVLAVIVALGQYFQVRFTMPNLKKKENDDKNTKNEVSFQDELAKSMGVQMKYVMPVFMFFIARSFPAIVSLYLITSSAFAIGQELYMRKKLSK
jgi:YidC/Oxa1 family membrane protein insertase